MMFNDRLRRVARRFRKSETGSATIEFVFVFIFFFSALAAAVEMGMLNFRHAMLERAVDLTIRDIRLGTGNVPAHSELLTIICDRAAIIPQCQGNLRLEMISVDPRAFGTFGQSADCLNGAEDPRPVRAFVSGQDNDLMLIRACLKYQPIFPTAGLGNVLSKDSQGYAHMLVTSSFVQEPR